MPEKTTIGVNAPTRDLIREVKPSWMEYDEFLLEVLMHFDESELHLDPREMSYDDRISRAMEDNGISERALEYELDPTDVDVLEDATPVSS